MSKAKRLFSMDDIYLTLGKIWCKLNCIQPYPRKKIVALKNKTWRDNDIKFWKHTKFEIHKQFQEDKNGNRVVKIKGTNVCLTA